MNRIFLILTTFLVLLTGYTGFAQRPTTKKDSLMLLLKHEKDLNKRIKLMIRLGNTDNTEEAILYTRKAVQLAQQHNFKKLEAIALLNLSLGHRTHGDYDRAIEASLNALRIYEELGEDSNPERASIYMQIGSHYSNQKNYPKGLSYLQEGLKIFELDKDTFNIVLSNINIGETYRLMNKLDSAKYCFERCLHYNKFINNEEIRGYTIGNLGLVHGAQGKTVLAKEQLTESIDILTRLNDPYSVSVYQSEFGLILIKEGHKQEGLDLLLTSLALAKKENLKEQIRDINIHLAKFYESEKQFQTALNYRKNYESYHDSLKNIETVRKIEQLEGQYKLDLKEADIELLEQSNQSKKRMLILLSLGSFILLTLSFFLYRTNKQRLRANIKLSEQNTIIEKKEREKALLLRELNHRVKNNLQMVSSLFNMQARHLKGNPAAEILKAGKLRVEALSLIHQNLYREDIDTSINLNEYLTELIENLIFNFGSNTQLEMDLKPIDVSLDTAIPVGLIINELTTNSLKYCKQLEHPVLKVSLQVNNRMIDLTLSDNGEGIPEDFNWKTSKSLGLKVVNTLSKQLGGNVTQFNANGCNWKISFPNKKD
ncbi:tetratricopeptide repeat protein [Puteibacter caeruleilacunae]|nr:tetratricopeptide repeat protein [Puteibacter caeruleilacunae]